MIGGKALTNEVEGQIPQECESRKMRVFVKYVRMSEMLLMAAKKHGLKTMGIVGQGWMTKEINDKFME